MTEPLWALKEWAIAVEALGTGDLILLVRKGGSHESRRAFDVPCDRALLFPTYEHQQASALRSPFQSAVTPRIVPALGDVMLLQYWANVTHQLPLAGPGIVEALHPFHIWTDDWLAERLAWKPERPAYALLLRVQRLVTPVDITYQAHHQGCRSWITLQDEVTEWPNGVPVLSDQDYHRQVTQIQAAIAEG
ncbi:MAG: DUF1802 family protein [Leptolyngbyaceae cyanobacterium]